MAKLRYGKYKSSVEIEGPLKETIFKAMRAASSEIIDAIDKTVDDVEADAKKDWPVRQKRFGKSKDSKSKITGGVRLIPPNTIEGFVGNSAPYAWAIKAGRESDTSVQAGERVADALIWSPMRQKSDRLAVQIAEKIIKKTR
tara:strand:- start:16 stop:441 length:426 start_codon:yes stop_codon:yes gene_type:complete